MALASGEGFFYGAKKQASAAKAAIFAPGKTGTSGTRALPGRALPGALRGEALPGGASRGRAKRWSIAGWGVVVGHRGGALRVGALPGDVSRCGIAGSAIERDEIR